MSPLLVVAGILLCTGSLLAVVLLVIWTPGPRIPAERRRGPGALRTTASARAAAGAVELVNRATRGGTNSLFGASRLELAGVEMEPAAFTLLVICSSVVAAVLGVLLGGLRFWSIPIGGVLALLTVIGARVLLRIRTDRRRAAFAEQLDDSLGLLSGGLRAGHSILRAVDAASKDLEPPTSQEFARVVNETRIGRDLGDAFNQTADRMQSDDFRWVAQAVAITRESGGNLSDVLEQAARTIRERGQIRRQVRALSAEGRFSALILIMLPIVLFFGLLILNPGYFNQFFHSIIGILAMVVAVVLLIVGAIWMRAATKVKF